MKTKRDIANRNLSIFCAVLVLIGLACIITLSVMINVAIDNLKGEYNDGLRHTNIVNNDINRGL